MSQNGVKEKSQFGLLTTKRFAPYIWAQFLGAFNDNVFKNGLIILIAYKGGNRIGHQIPIFS